MIKNFDDTLKDIDGKDLEENGAPVLERTIIIRALLAADPATGADKARRFDLAMQVKAGGDIEFTPEDLSLIKKLVGENFAPIVVGQLYKKIDA